jgi:hypothetical protein
LSRRRRLTVAKLWESQRGGWSIKGIICQQAFWDRDGTEPTEYAEGEFERVYAEKPLVKLHYPGGASMADLLALPLILQQLQASTPKRALHPLDAGRCRWVVVTITLDDLAGRSAEIVAWEREAIQGKLQRAEAERDLLTKFVVPQLLDRLAGHHR